MPQIETCMALGHRRLGRFGKQVCRNHSAELSLAVWAIVPVVFRNRGYRQGGSFTRWLQPACLAGGEFLVHGASAIAAALRVTPLVIGLTVVAFATSAPELGVSLRAAFSGATDIAMGNGVLRLAMTRRAASRVCPDRIHWCSGKSSLTPSVSSPTSKPRCCVSSSRVGT